MDVVVGAYGIRPYFLYHGTKVPTPPCVGCFGFS